MNEQGTQEPVTKLDKLISQLKAVKAEHEQAQEAARIAYDKGLFLQGAIRMLEEIQKEEQQHG